MERIGDAMKRVVNAPSLAAKYEELRQEVLEDIAVQQFISEHSDEINTEVVNRSLGKLYEFSTASHACERCPNLEGCVNVMKGFEPKLVIAQRLIDLDYVVCPTKQLDDERRNVSKMVNSMYMPKDVMEARLSNVDFKTEDSRVQIMRAAKNFLNTIDSTGEIPERGLYLYGDYGVGKSFILGALANELATRKIQTVVVYVPEFLREMKQSIQNQTLDEKVEFVKKAPILMLDDIGAETMSSWTRDEVLGTILQYRMAEKLPVFFTSNFDYDVLEHHLTTSQRGEKEPMKAGRLMERIRMVSTPLKLGGKNWRD
ncbi:primosomal protein DnaI [Mammaliicoccus sciuri]|uniref:Primosomal protein DnaI n=2 Tax=Sporosarcina newyorkensis TaxID=759851 RepID=A0A1T4XRH0_9BACL|nr:MULTISPECIES: primosomal protein DnaI [Sporosarcina]EGQ22287.1 primosomal protein DnaI [Sporosarcina newyorkensis 2681]MBY0222381.1 primosomal protein DnaI [Sporosarcina aquimarina]SKA91728.1 primosomal protein DnaI [Sporosarcina newyorkensis]